MTRRNTDESTATASRLDRKSTRLNSSHTVIYTLSLHDALPILPPVRVDLARRDDVEEELRHDDQEEHGRVDGDREPVRSEEHTSELQSHRDLHSFPTRRSSDLATSSRGPRASRRRRRGAASR